MKGVAEEIRNSTEHPMSILGFKLIEVIDDTMYSLVAYISERGRVAFATDVREQELLVRITTQSIHLDTDIRVLCHNKLGLRKGELGALADKVRADDPGSVRSWLSSRMALIASLLSEPRLWS